MSYKLETSRNGLVSSRNAISGSLTVIKDEMTRSAHQLHVGYTIGIGSEYRTTEVPQISFWYKGKQVVNLDFEQLAAVMEEAKPKILAMQFAKVLQSWLTPEDMKQIVTQNSTEEYQEKGFCATHNFCDPNVAMDQAFSEVFSQEADTQNSEQISLMQEAWTIAKNQNFYITE